MARSEKMEKEVTDELIRNGFDRDEAYVKVGQMRTNELVKAYYHKDRIESKPIEEIESDRPHKSKDEENDGEEI